MTPEELDKIEALVKAATPGEWYRELHPDGDPIDGPNGSDVESNDIAHQGERIAQAGWGPDAAAIVALHNAAPALIAAARQVSGYQAECHEIDQVLGRALGYPGNPDGADGICTGEHTPASLACEAAREVERLRAFVPRWKREDGMWTLRVGTLMVARISQFDGGIVPVVREDNGGRRVLDSAPDVESAARAVCVRLGIPYVPVEVDDG